MKETDEEGQNKKMKAMLKKKFANVFGERLGAKERMHGPEAKLEVDEEAEAQPINLDTTRPIPRHMREPVDEVVNHLIASVIIEPVHHPTAHCSSAHFVAKKNSSVRTVTDFHNVNEKLKRSIKPFYGSEKIRK